MITFVLNEIYEISVSDCARCMPLHIECVVDRLNEYDCSLEKIKDNIYTILKVSNFNPLLCAFVDLISLLHRNCSGCFDSRSCQTCVHNI